MTSSLPPTALLTVDDDGAVHETTWGEFVRDNSGPAPDSDADLWLDDVERDLLSTGSHRVAIGGGWGAVLRLKGGA